MEKGTREECFVAKIAPLLGDEAVLLIVRDLLEGSKRYSELESSLEGVSTRTITKKLNLLIQYGLVTKNRFAECPPRVEYSLTQKGRKLHTIIDELRYLGENVLS